MSYAPASLIVLGQYLQSQGAVNLGIVGNYTRHCKGYHLGKDRIFGPCACKPNGVCKPGLGYGDYSVYIRRDRDGLTDAASAIDIGKINGTLQGLRNFSEWLVKECENSTTDTLDIKEVIFSPDGINVFGWVSGYPYLIPNYGDKSHTGHTHISWFRDSQLRSKLSVFIRYFEVEHMIKAIVRQLWQPTIATDGTSNGVLRATPELSAPIVTRVPVDKIITTIAEIRTPSDSYNKWRIVETSDRSILYMYRTDWKALTIIPTVGV